MESFATLLLTLIITALSTDASSSVSSNTSSTQHTGGGATSQAFRGRFTNIPQLPSPTVPSASAPSKFSDTGSVEDTVEPSTATSSTGFSGSDDVESSILGSSSKAHSVGSDDEDYSIEYPSDDGSVGRDSGSQMFIIDASASSDSDTGSGGSSIRSAAFYTSISVATIVVTALILV